MTIGGGAGCALGTEAAKLAVAHAVFSLIFSEGKLNMKFPNFMKILCDKADDFMTTFQYYYSA